VRKCLEGLCPKGLFIRKPPLEMSETVQQLADRVKVLSDKLMILNSETSGAYDSLQKPVKILSSKEYTESAANYDRLFQEEEAKLQAMGGKTRKQTLQEFVLLFFFVSFGVFTVALALMVKLQSGTAAAVKICVAMFIILLVASALVMRYG